MSSSKRFTDAVTGYYRMLGEKGTMACMAGELEAIEKLPLDGITIRRLVGDLARVYRDRERQYDEKSKGFFKIMLQHHRKMRRKS